MALVSSSYTPPGVYTTTVLNNTGATLAGNARVPVLIGEGQEFFTQDNVELHRGSSATADDLIVDENISNQVNGTTRTYQTLHFPVVTGTGSGTVSNNPSDVQVTAGGLPVNVVSLNGATGQFITQTIIPAGTNAEITYYFKKTDTRILNEDESAQVPAFASLVEGGLTFSLTIPGALGNDVTLAFTQAANGYGVADAQAVTGAGTNAISIELLLPSNVVRTNQDIVNLVNAGIETLSGGFLTVEMATGTGATAGTVQVATHFTGGAGQSTNTTFKVAFVPIVDGTNGGVVTTSPADVQVLVNGVTAVVTAVDGTHGLVTVQNPVAAGSSVEITYATNTYQNTADQLPAVNVASITEVGFGPNRSDFIAGTDYVLNGNQISWGASATTAATISTPGFTPINASVINTTLVDEKVYLQKCSGASSGLNSLFTLPDTPVDGSGMGRATDNPALVSVYLGPDPVTALASGPVRISGLSGAAAQVTLYNPAPAGTNVYATYYRTILNDHQFTVAVDVPGQPGEGTFTVTDELGQVAPSALPGAAVVQDLNFATTGLVWPNNFPDLEAALGGADETVTLTFQNDSLEKTITPAIQASYTEKDSTSIPRITFTASTPGTAGNTVTIALVGGTTGAADASAITVSGTAVSVEILMADNVTIRSWQAIVTLFATYPPTVTGVGVILCSGVAGADLTAQAQAMAATPLAGGAAAVTHAYANRYMVTTSRTAAQAAADTLGLTGGATTPATSNVGLTAVGTAGYLGQTYIDVNTAVKFTLVDPTTALSYGYVQLPSPSYLFQPGDTLTFTISRETGLRTGSTVIAIPGLRTTVVTTLGMNVGDTATISTFNRAGNSPSVGEYYYVSFTTAKQASDYALQTFTSAAAAYAVYGQPTVANRLSLAIQLLTQNGAQQFACVQVQTQQGLPVASDQSFVDAINSLTTPLPGGRRPNVIVPLSTSATVQQSLGQFLTKQATPRQKGEAIGFIGFDAYTTPIAAVATAQAIANNRIVAVAPFSVGIMLQGPTDIEAVEYALTGEFVAAALAGLNLSPVNDVATTLTNQTVTGFSRSLVTFDAPTMDLMAASGITVLTDVAGGLNVRHYKTTDPSNPLTSEPYITTTNDFIAQAFRKSFRQFIGLKMTSELPSSIEVVGNALLSGFKNILITQADPVVVTPSVSDPTTVAVSVSYVPMFSLLTVNMTFTVNLTSGSTQAA